MPRAQIGGPLPPQWGAANALKQLQDMVFWGNHITGAPPRPTLAVKVPAACPTMSPMSFCSTVRAAQALTRVCHGCAQGRCRRPGARAAHQQCPMRLLLPRAAPACCGRACPLSARARQQPWPCCPPAHGLNAGLNAPLDTADSVGCFYKPYLDPGRAGAPTAA